MPQINPVQNEISENEIPEIVSLGKKTYFFKVFDVGANKFIAYFYGEDNQAVMMIGDFTLSNGQFVYKDDRIKLTSKALLNHKAISGTAGFLSYTVADGQITFNSTSATDNSTITALIVF